MEDIVCFIGYVHKTKQTMQHVSGRKRLYQSADDGHEEEDQCSPVNSSCSASGGLSKSGPVAPQSSLATDAFAVALETLPADDWGRTWVADRTMMLRMTSNRVKNAVDKLCPPTIVVVRPVFSTNHILTQLEKMTSRCLITILDLKLAQIGDKGARRLAEVLPQCPALSGLNLTENHIGVGGGRSLGRVLPQCPALSHLNLKGNQIGCEGTKMLREAWCGAQDGLCIDDVSDRIKFLLKNMIRVGDLQMLTTRLCKEHIIESFGERG